jgi:hypothetical protein
MGPDREAEECVMRGQVARRGGRYSALRRVGIRLTSASCGRLE